MYHHAWLRPNVSHQSSINVSNFSFLFFFFFKDRVFTSPGHQWNYVDQPGIKSQRSACLYLPITGLEGVHYYAGLNQRKLIREYVCEEKKVVIKWKSKTKLKTKTRKTQIEKHWKSQDDLVNLGSDKYFSCVCLCIHSLLRLKYVTKYEILFWSGCDRTIFLMQKDFIGFHS